MDVKQAIEAIKANYPHENYTELKEALDLAIQALEKQMSEKPYKIDGWHCGACKKRIYTTSIKPIYCPRCGQKIDWE